MSEPAPLTRAEERADFAQIARFVAGRPARS